VIAISTSPAPLASVSRSASAARCTLLALLILTFALASCRQPKPEQVTLNFFRPQWSQPTSDQERAIREFTSRTGIQIKSLPVPESTLDTLDLSRKLLSGHGSGPDVLFIDLIWTGVLSNDVIDLRPSFAAEISSIDPVLTPNYTADGRLVAVPYQAQVAVLQYRADLLREYGYSQPPATWDELERMAKRIQDGERAKDKKNFWGYLWQGVAGEALTCDALEWQVSEGGGHIIEDDGTISVNNPVAIRSWLRVKRWIGSISPPSVVSYSELDSGSAFDAGGAAFARVWRETTITPDPQTHRLRWRIPTPSGSVAYTRLPSGSVAWAGSLGGVGLGVSRYSLHPKEAGELIRALVQSQFRSDNTVFASQPVEDGPQHGAVQSGARQFPGGIISRPSTAAGRNYEQVTRAYIEAVHSVLTGERSGPHAAAELESQLIKITGKRAGPPKAMR